MTGRTLTGLVFLVLGLGDLLYLDFIAAPAAFSDAAVVGDGDGDGADDSLDDVRLAVADPNPVVEEPVVEEPVVEEPVVEEPLVEEPLVEEPVVEEPVVEEPVVEEPVVAVVAPNPIQPVTVEFWHGSDRVLSSSRRRLREMAVGLRAQPGRTVSIIGHTNSTGPDDLNQRLSVRRAENVGRVLGQFGVPTRQMTIEGRGEREPLDPGTSPEALARNRRVELRAEESNR